MSAAAPVRPAVPGPAAGHGTSLEVMAVDREEELKALDGTLVSIETVLDLDGLRGRLAELGEQASDPALWEDQDRARSVQTEMSHLGTDLDRVGGLRERLEDVRAAFQLGDPDLDAEGEAALPALRRDIEALEVRTLLAGEYDAREALVTIRAEAGGVDAADFAMMLLRMYTRYAERHGYAMEVYDTSYAEEAGIKSATFRVGEPYAYGTLAGEQGTHRLVRISPFDNQGRRQTSFAGVEVVPVVEQTDKVEIPEDEIRVDVYRSSGPGGQGVNTTDSAVRITHLPTGIVVSCQNERSQIQNRASAMLVLSAKILEVRRREEQAKIDSMKDASGGSWGNQIRSYVLHPYQMVKDLRTEVETGNTGAVLDGDIDEFVEAEIRWKRGQAVA